MFGKSFLPKRVAVTAAAFAVAAVAGIATVAIVPALASGAVSNGAADLAATSSPSAQAAHPALKALAARRIALALFRTSVQQTGLSRATVLKDLLNGETLAQIDGSKAQAVESAVMAKVTTRLNKAEANGKISKTQEATLVVGRARRDHQADEPQPQHIHPRSLRRTSDRPHRRPRPPLPRQDRAQPL